MHKSKKMQARSQFDQNLALKGLTYKYVIFVGGVTVSYNRMSKFQLSV